MIHELKTLAPYWDAVDRGDKTFEVRRDDRGFQRGDVLRLYRTESISEVSGWKANAMIERRIAYVLSGGQCGIEAGFVVLALTNPPTDEPKPLGADPSAAEGTPNASR